MSVRVKSRARLGVGYARRRLIGAVLASLVLSFFVTGEQGLAQIDPLVDPGKRGGAREKPDPAKDDSPPDGPTPRDFPRSEPLAACSRLVPIPVEDIALAKLVDSVRGNNSDAVECASLASVIARLSRRPRTSGPRLDGPALDVKRAEADRQRASRQPAVRARLDRVAKDAGHDDELRLMYEAAVFEAFGFSSARDLKLRELLRHLD